MFETNSSSSHSIILNWNKFKPDSRSLPVNLTGEIEIFAGEFGWGYDEFNDAATKASYILTHIKEVKDRNSLETLQQIIETETGRTIIFCPCEAYYEWGYIDHQSRNVARDALESEKSLRNFIFNPKSILVIDNDNH